MSDKNPIILLQLLHHYYHYCPDGARTFTFTKNNRLRVHKETDKEVLSRKSRLNESTIKTATFAIRTELYEALRGRMGKIFIENPEKLKRLGVPLKNSVGESGYGILPVGSRMPIPDGKKIRAFTYWEKVNDIDLSCFGLMKYGTQKEFSWRTMYSIPSDVIAFSGDETSGYSGGSEYFDIDIQRIKEAYPDYEYIVLCDNVFTGRGSIHFKDVAVKGGFMSRDILDSGEVFEPSTVETSFPLTSDSSFCYMFGIDLNAREVVWLNMAREGDHAIAGNTEMNFLRSYLDSVKIFSVFDLCMYCGMPVPRMEEADWIFTDDLARDGTSWKDKIIHSWDTEKILSFMQPK